jgi:alkylation response protein AidB-like acyl-CoA dehydrogenase
MEPALTGGAAQSIFGGTTEIQKQIIARGLGL